MKELTVVAPTAPVITGDIIISTAVAERDTLVADAKEFRVIHNVETLEAAVNQVRLMKDHASQIEKDRETVKNPFFQIGKKIDEAAKLHKAPISAEVSRLEAMIGRYNQEIRDAKLRAEQEAQRKLDEAAANIRKAQEEADAAAKKLLEATTPAERTEALQKQLAAEEIVEDLGGTVKALVSTPVAPTKTMASGGANTMKIVVEITDIKALYAARPELVSLAADENQIKYLYRRDKQIALPGVKISEQPIFSVRL